ncbi:Murein hydrolase activator NlpD OS=Afipia felis OX=1035 GN=nlpD PE=3 SV=1 [Afipia felis]
MSRLLDLLGARRAPSLAVMALVSVSFGGCSADYDSRFSDNSLQNPFASQRSETTGAVRQNHYAQRELPQYSRPATSPVISAPLSYPVAQGTSGGGRGVASYTPPGSNPIEHTGSVAPRSVAAAQHEGGTRIIVGTSDTLEGLARRYNVSSAEIMRANGYRGPRALSPGQSLIIPKRTAHAETSAASHAPATRAAAMPSSVHVAASGDTLMNISRRNHISVQELARANNLPVTAQIKIGDRITVPSSSKTLGAAPQTARPAAVAAAPQPQPVAAKPVATAAAEPVQKARMATETKEIEQTHAQSPVKTAEATNALPTFRWPVRGRVIAAYGAKTNGKQNDGINVAVPEGTPVKAAEDGVVAYSGNELKGYGNLILVRHASGYVTAYAHASELMVKRGDTIKRGQVIAKSGQSGEVGSPQLHFEIRKGSSPVDPLQFLNGA